MNVYVISMSTGEYSDRTEWTVRAYSSEEKARAFLEKFMTEFNTRWAQCLPNHISDFYRKKDALFAKGWFPDLPDLDLPDYTGFHMWIDEVELID